MSTWRFLDTGVLSGAENMAWDKAILEVCGKGASPNTFRILQFDPPAVLVGFHQSVEQEVRVEYCRQEGIDVNRRITGGGAIFFDTSQIGWEVIADRDTAGLPRGVLPLYRKLCELGVAALARLGVKASFRPINDVEVDGKKISGTGGTEEGNAFLFQSTLLVDFDLERMLRALKIPIEKLQDKEIESARERVTCLAQELGWVPTRDAIVAALRSAAEEALGIRLVDGEASGEERALQARYLAEFEKPEWIHKVREPEREQPIVRAIHKIPGNLIQVAAQLNLRRRLLKYVTITGDFFAYPSRTIADLEAAFKECPAEPEAVRKVADEFFARTGYRVAGVEPRDFADAIVKVLAKLRLKQIGFTLEEIDSIHLVLDPMAEEGAIDLLLLPYCSKLVGCKFRHEPDCPACGKCDVGDAMALAERYGMRFLTITSFEHLMATLEEEAARGTRTYVGCCCSAFVRKHQDEMAESGLAGLLVDIDNSTCYDLELEHKAYVGEFESQTNLKMGLLEKVLDQVAPAGARFGGRREGAVRRAADA